jgi:protein-S-isoprenylcysteine O-methyltransferase Ste14
MRRILFFGYGLIAYASFLAAFLYLIGFMGNLLVPKSIDSGVEGNLGGALAVNLVLILVFGLQHVIMARPGFKEWWTQFVPRPIERSTYVFLTNVILFILFWQWRPITTVVWDVSGGFMEPVLWSLFAFAWLLILITSFLINHFDLFGLRQVYLYLKGVPYTHLKFNTVGVYKYIRHPLMVGWILGFWSTPVMTVGHLFFAITTTIYIITTVPLEEKDLLHFLGEDYEKYLRRTPRYVPFLGNKEKEPEESL